MANIFGNGLIGRVDVNYISKKGWMTDDAGNRVVYFYTERSDNRNYYLKDHLGSNRMTINSLGVVTNVQDFYAYGEVLRSYNNSTPNEKYKFTGKERDTETDLDYFGARFYDSELGRWTSIDPLASKYPAWSPYNYCVNNPLIYVDPNGTFADPIMQDRNDNIGGEDEKTKKAREEEKEKQKNNSTEQEHTETQTAQVIPIPQVPGLPLPIAPPDNQSAANTGRGIIELAEKISEVSREVNTLVLVSPIIASETIINMFAEHTKKRKVTWDKHTKPRSGRETEKKKSKPDWRPNPNKRKEQ